MVFNRKEYDKKYLEENKERLQAQRKKYYEENKERLREYSKKYREENKERIRVKEKEYKKKYYEKNKERLRDKARKWDKENEYSKKYYQSNKEHCRKINKEYRKKHKVRLNKLSSKTNKKAWGDFNSPVWFNRRCSVIKARARARELDFNLDAEYLKSIFPKDKRCPALGIPFKVLDIYAKGKELQQKVSLDRIDSSKGYIKGNVQWVSLLANVITSNATPDQVIQVGQYFKKVTEELNNGTQQ